MRLVGSEPGRSARPVGTPLVANARYLARNAIGSDPRTAALLRLRPEFRDRLVTPASDLCLEGFPRSGNSFVLKAFTRWNPGAAVAHHLHVPGQVARAARFGVPCLVLVREPADAVASLLVAAPALDAGIVLASYASFHRRVSRHRDASVIVPFDDAVARPWEAIAAVNDRFGTDFTWRVLDQEERAALIEAVREWNVRDRQPPALVAVPSGEKEVAKARVRPMITRHRRFVEARATYDLVLDAARGAWQQPGRNG